jgi:hypothetical protein
LTPTLTAYRNAEIDRSGVATLYRVLIAISVFFIPMKALAITVAGQSVYIPYIGLAIASIFLARQLFEIFLRWFAKPMAVVWTLTLFYYWQTGFQANVFVFGVKIFITFAMAAVYVILLRENERPVIKALYAGAVVSVFYMLYQGISLDLFGSSLPFTAIDAFQIGRGLGSRYGFVRTTGFTEEPSYIAVMMVGIALIVYSFGKRSGESQTGRFWVLGLGLLLCTSNSLIATIPLLAIFTLFSFLRAPFAFFVCFYLVNLFIAPYVVNLDETFFARFSSYQQFLSLPSARWWFGIGFNQYATTFQFPTFYSPEGVSTLVVDSIASLWGGVLLEGGIVFATLFCFYLSRISQASKDATGFALIAILIMLANYYSPWWPIVSFALAYTVISRLPRNDSAIPATE